jgi:tetratricopeptide (TPR) repeat protein
MSVRLLLLLAVLSPSLSHAEADPDRMKTAKALILDRHYAEARQALQGVQAQGPDAEGVLYWVARCSDGLGEDERALREYGVYLDHHPSDPVLKEEALTSRVRIAARLYKAGAKEHVGLIRQSVEDPDKAVRYYAALQLANLGKDVGAPAIQVLKEIVAKEKDPDLADRARLSLLKLDPSALQGQEAKREDPAPRGKHASWIKVRVTKAGRSKPEVLVNLPVALAQLVFESLPDDARKELRKKGFDPDNFWERLLKLGPTQIVHIEGEDGELIDIWLE